MTVTAAVSQHTAHNCVECGCIWVGDWIDGVQVLVHNLQWRVSALVSHYHGIRILSASLGGNVSLEEVVLSHAHLIEC